MKNSHHPTQAQADSVTDPVCGAVMQSQDAAQHYDYHELTYYFDRSECLQQFLADPEKFTQPID